MLFGCSSENGWSWEEVTTDSWHHWYPQSYGRGLGGSLGEVTEAQGVWDLLKVSQVRTGAARRAGSRASGVRPTHPVSNWLLCGGYTATEGQALTGRREQGLTSPDHWIHLCRGKADAHNCLDLA